ncbi:L-fucose:H+ symporter permease [Plebeiibacterium marinum]|uniref:L-fucose:H+ symporter permease n=1 Tax=Plebeiibacterium marinum TaxID=2992111 RepID=A0AAE3SJU1_9BACT|nr:L-fucose:H+ symporter permease [Plebeiobacterium marinum]MCW3805854.1 L-fucose:H+ symporter permease [Plebeiobacterium marinum]
MNSNQSSKGVLLEKKYILSFILLSSCFMWWGIANNLTDPLVKVFKAVFGELSTFQASLIQFAFYFGYFCMALPGAAISRKFSYKTGVLVGLGVYALGCFLLYPATLLQEFVYFCVSYYVLACGLGILETNANPYIIALGDKQTATRRLNFAQSFNPIGAITGIVLCQVLIMSRMPVDALGNITIPASKINETLHIVIFPYLSVAGILALVWMLIAITKMPKVSDEHEHVHIFKTFRALFNNANYTFAVVAQFFYVGAQISVWTYTNFYIPEHLHVTPDVALQFHTGALVLFSVARWVFTILMKKFKAQSLLLFSSVLAIVLCLLVVYVGGKIGVFALIGISGCMSLMFPTIFGLGSEGLSDAETKVASSGLIMAILGGALITPLHGFMIDLWGVSLSYLLPLLCFVIIGSYAYTKIKLF